MFNTTRLAAKYDYSQGPKQVSITIHNLSSNANGTRYAHPKYVLSICKTNRIKNLSTFGHDILHKKFPINN